MIHVPIHVWLDLFSEMFCLFRYENVSVFFLTWENKCLICRSRDSKILWKNHVSPARDPVSTWRRWGNERVGLPLSGGFGEDISEHFYVWSYDIKEWHQVYQHYTIYSIRNYISVNPMIPVFSWPPPFVLWTMLTFIVQRTEVSLTWGSWDWH